MLDLAKALEFSNQTADAAGKLALEQFRKRLAVEHKADNSPVTVVDRRIERFLRSRIVEMYPDHGIIGEEEGQVRCGGSHVWVVDPIDGTKSYITGHPLFGCLMGLIREGKPCLGQIDIPATGERWCGVAGQPSTFNGEACTTSDCTSLALAAVYTTDPTLFTGGRESALNKIESIARLIRFGGDCYSYGLLASGHCDAVIETGLEPYDYLPLVQVIVGAGGLITDWKGAPLTAQSNGDVVAAATSELHGEIIDILRQQQAEAAE